MFTLIKLTQILNIPLFAVMKVFLVSRYVGVDNVRAIDRKSRVVVASNHVFYSDPFLIGFGFPFNSKLRLTPMSYFIANRFFSNPILYPFMRILGGFPAKEHPRLGYGLEEARKRLHKGMVTIFPEGKLTRFKGQFEPKWGISSLAKDKNTLVIPVYIEKTKKSLFKTFKITYGTPQNMSGKSPQEIMDIIYDL